jgi:hypothetical protein
MNQNDKSPDENNDSLSAEERKLRLDEHKLEIERQKLLLDNDKFAHDRSFIKTWLPIILPVCATVGIAVISSTISLIDKKAQEEATKRAGIEAEAKDKHDWSVKVVELYLKNPASFDLTADKYKAGRNLQLLASVAPAEVQSVLEIEVSKLTPSLNNEGNASAEWLTTLGAISKVQRAIHKSSKAAKVLYGRDHALAEAVNAQDSSAIAKPEEVGHYQDMTAYVQYPETRKDEATTAKELLVSKGMTIPSMQVSSHPPDRLLVKYYLHKQKLLAEALASELQSKLNLKASEARKIKSEGHTMPDGILEIWLPN